MMLADSEAVILRWFAPVLLGNFPSDVAERLVVVPAIGRTTAICRQPGHVANKAKHTRIVRAAPDSNRASNPGRTRGVLVRAKPPHTLLIECVKRESTRVREPGDEEIWGTRRKVALCAVPLDRRVWGGRRVARLRVSKLTAGCRCGPRQACDNSLRVADRPGIARAYRDPANEHATECFACLPRGRPGWNSFVDTNVKLATLHVVALPSTVKVRKVGPASQEVGCAVPLG